MRRKMDGGNIKNTLCENKSIIYKKIHNAKLHN